jgi:hypothetical protein
MQCYAYLKFKKDLNITIQFSETRLYVVQFSLKYLDDHLQPGHGLASFAVMCVTLSMSARSFICLAATEVEQSSFSLLPAWQSCTQFLSCYLTQKSKELRCVGIGRTWISEYLTFRFGLHKQTCMCSYSTEASVSMCTVES